MNNVRTEEEMNSIPNEGATATVRASTRPFYWSVVRELWENRSLYIAPLIVAVVQVFGFAISAVGLAERRQGVLSLDPALARARIEPPYDIAAMIMMMTVGIVGIFYCLDALYGERRDRSILFWKSMPVSDLTSVLAKVTIPQAILPFIACVLVVVIQVIILLITSATLLAHGMSPASTWTYIPFFQNWVVFFYGMIALSLWLAPVYAWLLLVSAAVRRAAFLWAVLPWFVIGVFERITFGTAYFGQFVRYRLVGFAPGAFDFHGRHYPSIDTLAQLTPGRYLASPCLWLGLLVAAVFIAAAVRLRRYRGPI